MTIMPGHEVEVIDLTQIVGEFSTPCDWAAQQIHLGDGPAAWIAHLAACGCGRVGARLICESCKDRAIATNEAAECGECGEVYVPFRQVIRHIEPLA